MTIAQIILAMVCGYLSGTVWSWAARRATSNPRPKVNHELRRQQCIRDGIPFDTVPPPRLPPKNKRQGVPR